MPIIKERPGKKAEKLEKEKEKRSRLPTKANQEGTFRKGPLTIPAER